MTNARKASHIFFAALIVAACALRLGNVILAGLFSYMILDLTHRRLSGHMPDLAARLVSLGIFLVTATSLAWMVGQFLKLAVYRMPLIISSVMPTLDRMAASYGLDLPFDNLRELRGVIILAIKGNAQSITKESGLLTRGFFQIVIGVFIAIMKFFPETPRPRPGTLFEDLSSEFNQRMSLFMGSYEKVLGAQVLISLINTLITAVFIMAVGIPYTHFLILGTFILGIIPLIGNIMANTIIIGSALTLSPQHAFIAFVFLILSHKAQYFLNSHIIGSTLKTPMWVTLLGILVGEVLLGVPGIILAPALLHYAREELASIPGRTSAL